ncbi:MAG: LptF/LptG family permease [Verrucomicrobiota bacterium]
MGSLSRNFRFLSLVAVLAAAGAALCVWLVGPEQRAMAEQLAGFPDSDPFAHGLRPWVLAGLCFLPMLAGVAYACAGTMCRYVVRQFLGIFAISLAALFSIWLLMDLSDNIGDFRQSASLLRTMAVFYASRAPAILVLLLPYSLLLALLYSMGKLSTHREIVAMIQSGRGVIGITLPLILAGLFCTLFSLGLNFHWAPVAEGTVDDLLDRATGKQPAEARQVLYLNADARRLWMVGMFPPHYEAGAPLKNIEVTTTDDAGFLRERLSAASAVWNPKTHLWSFESAVLARFKAGEPPRFEEDPAAFSNVAWPETPLQLIKPGLNAAFLGMPDLQTWFASHRRNHSSADPAPYRTQWHYRWALPFTCLVTVLLATPLAIHFARRAPAGGVFFAVLLSALLMLISSISLALGEAGLVPPMLAAWFPNILFALIGLYLYRRRITGRPIYQILARVLPGN